MKKILVVDDSKELLETCRIVLSRHNFEVATAEGANEAMGIINNTFALVITDFEMPGINGLELAHLIKRKFSNIPIILISGNPDVIRLNKLKLTSHFICDFIKKPFLINDLIITISRQLK